MRGLARRREANRTHLGSSRLNVVKTFPLFEARGWGFYSDRAPLTIDSVNETIPALLSLCEPQSEEGGLIERLSQALSRTDGPDELRLRDLFLKYGSDKSMPHDYYKIYSELLRAIEVPRKLFEIGLGTNNRNIVSTMGISGQPGASLRAFRDFCPECEVIGADVDRAALFSEERIRTFHLDQTKSATFDAISDEVGWDFDLMIDDGLHSPHANLRSLRFFLSRIREGGFAVIEDIYERSVPIWLLASQLLGEEFESALISTSEAHMFVVRKRPRR